MTRFVERYLAPGLLIICVVLGGASAAGFVANAAVQIIAIVVVAFLLLGDHLPDLPRPARILLTLLAFAAGMMLVQLLPMPEALWSRLPGRSEVARSIALAGAGTPWLPISLAPDATLSGFLALLPPLAMILSIFASSGYGRIYTVYALIICAIASTILGFAQRAGGSDSILYIYLVTNRGSPVGLFANRNHLATLLLATIPFVASLAVSPSRKSSSDSRIGRRLIAACVVALLVLGIVYIHSDAGWLLCIPCLLASAAVLQRGERGALSRALGVTAAGTIVIALALALFAPIVVKDASDKVASAGPQQRSTIITTTLRAAADYLPLGSGAGSFPVIYPSYENPEGATGEFINHSHSDYAEFILEYGIPGAILLLVAAALWIRRLPSLWRSSSIESGIARAGFVSIGLVAAHSLVDYPIRTAAIAAIVAMASALMVAPTAAETPSLHSNRRHPKPSNRTIMLGLAENQDALADSLLGPAA